MTFRKDWCKAFVESPLAGNWKLVEPMSSGIEYSKPEYDKLINVIKIKPKGKYPIVCPHCGAPHNPNEVRCEYCGGYMKEE